MSGRLISLALCRTRNLSSTKAEFSFFTLNTYSRLFAGEEVRPRGGNPARDVVSGDLSLLRLVYPCEADRPRYRAT